MFVSRNKDGTSWNIDARIGKKGSYLENGKCILDNISIFQKLLRRTIWNERLPSNSNPFEESIKRMKSATLDNLLISQHLIEYNLVRTINYILHLNNKFNSEQLF